MSTELKREIERVRAINRSLLNEETTKTAIVLPLLEALGWKASDPEEVYLEYRTASGAADIALSIERKPAVLVEAKSARHNLVDDDKTQLLKYCDAAGVQIGVLTNGFNWYLYCDAASPEKGDPVKIDLAEGDTESKILKITRDFSDFLSKARVDAGADARKAIDARRVDVALAKQWNMMLRDGDQKLVSALRSKMKKNNFPLSFPRVKGFIQQRSSAPAGDENGKKEKASARTLPGAKRGNLSREPSRTRTVKIPKPNSVRMFERTVEFNGWADMLRTFLDEVYRKDPKCLSVLVEHIPSKIVEGEANINHSWRAYQIAETGIWVNTNLNSGDIVGLCQEALKVLALPDDHFKLIYA